MIALPADYLKVLVTPTCSKESITARYMRPTLPVMRYLDMYFIVHRHYIITVADQGNERTDIWESGY